MLVELPHRSGLKLKKLQGSESILGEVPREIHRQPWREKHGHQNKTKQKQKNPKY
jgi:hypothetical protein